MKDILICQLPKSCVSHYLLENIVPLVRNPHEYIFHTQIGQSWLVLDCTFKCVLNLQAAAQQAQANAAEAAAKAAAAGLSANQKPHDASHEGTTYEEYSLPAQEAPQEYYINVQSNYQH